jgi:hypothetical protein
MKHTAAPYRVQKMLVIGLGGTGHDAVLNVKRKYREVYGDVPVPTTAFLVFDTDDPRPLDQREGTGIALEPGEFYKMTVANPRLVVDVNEEVRDWFPKDLRVHSITRGAGQVRAVGRLALYHNASEVYRRIKGALDQLNALKPHESLGQFEPVNDSVLINVVASLSGGTGSGTFLDVAYLCRHHMHPSHDMLAAYLLLPDVFVGRPGTGSVEPNAYGAMKELDMLMDLTMKSSRKEFLFGGETISQAATPFDKVFLVNNRNKTGRVFREVGELTELLGTGIFVAGGAMGHDAGSVRDNLHYQTSPTAACRNKYPHYASFGVAEVVFDTPRFVAEQVDRVSMRAIETLLKQAPAHDPALGTTDPVQAAEQLVGEIGLDSPGRAVDILNTPRQLPPFRKRDRVSFKELLLDFGGRDTYVRGQEVRVQQALDTSLPGVQQSAETALLERARGFAAEPHGLQRALAFLRTARSLLDAQRQAAESQAKEARERQTSTAARTGERLAEYDRAVSGFVWPWNWTKVRDLAANIEQSITGEGEDAAKVRRLDGAVAVITAAVACCNDQLAALEKLAQQLSALQRELRDRLVEGRRSKTPTRPFTIELPFPEKLKDEGQVDAGRLQQWLRAEGADLLEMGSVSNERLMEIFRGFAQTHASVACIKDQNLEQLFQDATYDLHHHVRLLDRGAEPLWQYETAYLSGGEGTSILYIFGVGNTDRTVFQTDSISRMLASSSSIRPSTTNDPDRVFCYKEEAAVPGFVLEHMSRYRNRYRQRESVGTELYHLDHRWAREAPDLWPDENTGTGKVGLGPKPKIMTDSGMAGGPHSENGKAEGAAATDEMPLDPPTASGGSDSPSTPPSSN